MTAAPADRTADGPPWLRLNARMIWVDALRVLLSLTPGGIAVFVVGVEPNAGVIWPVAVIAGWGVIGSVTDVLRWITTRYRVTESYVERRTGLFVRRYRSVRRDRIRSVDADARLLQRLAGLRRVKIGAGQANAAMESALVLNAVSREAAEDLRRRLHAEASPHAPAATDTPVAAERATGTRVFAELRWWWVVYNVFNIWAYAAAAGLLWGLYFTLTLFGLDPVGWLGSLTDWRELGWGWTAAVALLATGALGVGVQAWSFCTNYAHFRLERVPGENGTVLRTRHGLFRTQEITRDDNRLRGVTIAEPLLWRWMRLADTYVITTGLSMWSSATMILPRGPRSVAHRVASSVLDEPDSPLRARLRRHPRSALRRRLVWALLVTASATGLAGWLGATTALPGWAWWVTAAALLPSATGLALAGYRALGHTVTGDYAVLRSGALSRRTSALQRRAVSGVRVRQSLLQRRLGLASVTLTTASGWGAYPAADMDAAESAEFASSALPHYVAPFLDPPR